MSNTLFALLGYAGWTMLLAGSILSWRSVLVLTGKKQSNEFKNGEEHGSPLYWRVNRAHINAAENLPLFGAVVLVAGLTQQLESIATLSLALLGARISQSIFHFSGNGVWHVNFRFTCMLIQYGLLIWMGLRLLNWA